MEWATLIGAAVGFAISPVTLIELILVLVSKRRVINSIVLTLAIIGLSFVAVVIGAVGANAIGDTSSGPSTATGIIFLVLAALLIVLAVKNWRSRADSSEMPLFTKIADMGPSAVLLLAPGATIVNPKNLVILLSAGQSIGSNASGAAVLLPALIFVLLATAPFWLATVYALWGGASAERHLDALRGWLMAKNRLIMAIVLGLLGIALLAKGVAALIG
jgi:membrane protein YdbS with pleckstrin-like domain